ncbi:MAG: DUF5057 domain-containing protein [Butyrivibrio sp.]
MKDLKKKNRIAAFGAVLLSCILGLFGIMANQYLDVGADPSADTINGETPLDISNKQAGILKNIMEAGDKFTVLEIVPYETASIFNVITGSEELRNRLADQDAAKMLYDSAPYESAVTDGNITTKTTKNGLFGEQSVSIEYDSSTGLYNVLYPNYFLDLIIDKYEYPEYYEYFSENMIVESKTPAELKEIDFSTCQYDFIYVVNDRADELTAVDRVNYFAKTGTTSGSGTQKTYDSSNDIDWETAVKLIEMIYTGHSHTHSDDTGVNAPIPAIFPSGGTFSVDSSVNLAKFVNFMIVSTGYANPETNYADSAVVTVWNSTTASNMELKTAYNYLLNMIDTKEYSALLTKASEQGVFTTGAHVFNDIVVINSDTAEINLYNIAKGGTGSEYSQSASDRGVGKDGTYTVGDELEYLLGNYGYRDAKVKILEIEPCNDFEYDNLASIKKLADYLRMRGCSSWSSMDDVNKYMSITYLTTEGFNTVNYDLLAEFDLIIIGDKSGAMGTYNAQGGPIVGVFALHNDSTLNFSGLDYGYIYTSYGDTIEPDGTKRLAGNDISAKKLAELNEYVSVGKPVMLSSRLYDVTGSENTYVVQPSSNMYSFLTGLGTAKDNGSVISEEQASRRLYSAVSKHYMMTLMGTSNYNQTILRYDTDGLVSSEFIDTTKENAIDFTFAIRTTKNADCIVSLLYDKDMDGFYESSLECDAQMTSNTTYIETWKVTAKIPAYYSGLLSWKLVIEENTTGDREIKKFYSLVDEDVANAVVLEVVDDINNAYCNNDELLDLIEKAESKIGYGISMYAVTAEEFINQKGNQLDDLHCSILILSSNAITDIETLNAVQKFAEFGKTIILTSNCMDNAEYDNLFRNKFAMNRYNNSLSIKPDSETQGYTDYYLYQNMTDDAIIYGNAQTYGFGVVTEYTLTDSSSTEPDSSASWSKSYPHGSDGKQVWARVSVCNGDGEALFTKLQYVGSQEYTQSWGTLITYYYASSSAYTASDGEWKTSPEYSDDKPYLWVSVRWAGDGWNNNYKELATINMNSYTGSSESTGYHSYIADEANKSQITMYPYDVTETQTMNISGTTSQKYQLDMEENLVVWYTLSSDSSSTYYGDNPLNGRNNYYLYSIDKMIYTGMGSADTMTDEEKRLFVNMIVFGQTITNHDPIIKITNAAQSDVTGEYIIYTDDMDNALDIHFMAIDRDLGIGVKLEENKEINPNKGSIKWTANTSEGVREGSFDGSVFYNVKEMSLEIVGTAFRELMLQDMTVENEGHTVCLSAYKVSTDGRVTLTFEVSDDFGAVGTCTLTIINRDLFDLD